MITAAEKKADKFIAAVEKRIAWSNSGDRYSVEKQVRDCDVGLSSVSVVVTLRDELIGGQLWCQWLSFNERPNTASFLGGRYRWTLATRDRRIKKNYRRLWNLVDTFIYEYVVRNYKEYDESRQGEDRSEGTRGSGGVLDVQGATSSR
jgi:hypothetical protein